MLINCNLNVFYIFKSHFLQLSHLIFFTFYLIIFTILFNNFYNFYNFHKLNF